MADIRIFYQAPSEVVDIYEGVPNHMAASMELQARLERILDAVKQWVTDIDEKMADGFDLETIANEARVEFLEVGREVFRYTDLLKRATHCFSAGSQCDGMNDGYRPCGLLGFMDAAQLSNIINNIIKQEDMP